MSRTEAKGYYGNLFPFGRRESKGRVGCKCLVVGIMKERHVVTHVPVINEILVQAPLQVVYRELTWPHSHQPTAFQVLLDPQKQGNDRLHHTSTSQRFFGYDPPVPPGAELPVFQGMKDRN